MKIIFALIVCLASTSVAYAQGGLKGMLKKGTETAGDAVTAQVLVKTYCGASANTLKAYGKLLSASDNKELAEEAAAMARAVEGGTLNAKDMGDINKLSEKAEEEINKFKNEAFVLDEAARADYADGMIDLGKALIDYGAVAVGVKGFKPGIDPRTLAMTNLAVQIGKNLPGDMSRLKNITGIIINYSKANGIPGHELLAKALLELI